MHLKGIATKPFSHVKELGKDTYVNHMCKRC